MTDSWRKCSRGSYGQPRGNEHRHKRKGGKTNVGLYTLFYLQESNEYIQEEDDQKIGLETRQVSDGLGSCVWPARCPRNIA